MKSLQDAYLRGIPERSGFRNTTAKRQAKRTGKPKKASKAVNQRQ